VQPEEIDEWRDDDTPDETRGPGQALVVRGQPGRHRIPVDPGRRDGPVVEVGDTWGDDNPTLSPPVIARPRTWLVLGGAAAGVALVAAAVAITVRPAPPAPTEPTRPVLTFGLSDGPLRSATGPATSGTATPRQTAGAPSGTQAGSTGQPAGSSAPASATTTAGPTTSTPAWTTLTVQAIKVLNRGESVQTNRTRLAMQSNGDLVIVDEFGTIRWRASTGGHGHHAVFQTDGNFVVYDGGNSPLWTSGTAGHPGAILVLQANGDVTIMYNSTKLWGSNTAH